MNSLSNEALTMESDDSGVVEKKAFVSLAPLYDRLMQDVPYDEWVEYLNLLMQQRHFQPGRALDLACGTGSMTIRLSRLGLEMTGVDIAEDMVEQAKKKAEMNSLPITFYCQDAAELNIPGSAYDLCVSLFDSLNYILEPARLNSAIRQVAAHLRKDGLFIFDLNTEYALSNLMFDQNNIGAESPLQYVWTSEYFPETRLCRIRMLFQFLQDAADYPIEFEEIHWQYAYSENEVRGMLTENGFDSIAVYRAYTLRPPTPLSDRLYYIARKA